VHGVRGPQPADSFTPSQALLSSLALNLVVPPALHSLFGERELRLATGDEAVQDSPA